MYDDLFCRFDHTYPKDPNLVRYCDLTGKPFANNEPYFYVDGEVYSEEAHEFLYTKDEWTDIYNDDPEENYWSEEIYDLPEDELTTEIPSHIGYKDIYYGYAPNNQTRPVKLGTISEIVSKGNEYGPFSITDDFISNMHENKDKFNELMEQHHILKNPSLEDFQQVNELHGLNKDVNLDEILYALENIANEPTSIQPIMSFDDELEL